MLLNKNIILEILQSNFGDEVDSMIESSVMERTSEELSTVFEYSAEYALLDGIEEMYVAEYDVDEEHGIASVCGVLEANVLIAGYSHWDGEEMHVDDGMLVVGIGFCFDADEGSAYSNLHLEYLY